MAALGTTISAEDLALAGITGDLAAAITGLTWVEAKAKLSAVIALAAGNETLVRGGVTTISLNARTLSVNLEQLRKGLEAVRVGLSYAASTGGITALPIEWSDA